MSETGIYLFEGHGVRVVMRDGDPWFVAADVARALDYESAKDMTRLLDDEDKGGHGVPTPGGTQMFSIVSEGGLFQAIVQRQTGRIADEERKHRVRRFQRWVTHEVLPAIRKTGSYGQRNALAALSDPATLRQLLGSYAERVLAAEAAVEAARPKVEVYDRIVDSGDTVGFREACKLIRAATGASENVTRGLMRQRGWIQRLGGKLAPAHYGETHGYVTTREREFRGEDGEVRVKPELRITQKGVARAIEILIEEEEAA